MNTLLVKKPPCSDFVYTSALHAGWHFQLRSHICQKRPVTFDHWPLRKFPIEVLALISQHGYQHLTLENDRWQHFFVPPASEFKQVAPGEMTANGGVS